MLRSSRCQDTKGWRRNCKRTLGSHPNVGKKLEKEDLQEGPPTPNRGANKPLRGPRKELQESPAKELRKGPLKQKKKIPVKAGGGAAGRPRELVRTQERTWRRRRATGRENQPELKGRLPPNREADKPQERTRKELKEGPSREDRRDKEAQATKALGSRGGAKGRPQRDQCGTNINFLDE